MKIGLQVYTVRDEIAKDFENAFNEVKKAGCDCVELFGLIDKSADELKAFLDGMELSVPAIMFSLDEFVDDINSVISTCKTLGSNYAVCGFLVEEHRTDEGYLKVADIFEHAAAELQKHGITLAYHNHAFEFEKLESGKSGYDILVSNTSLLKFEVDVFWVQHANLDLIEKIREFGNRVGLIHLKDMDNQDDKNFCELGSGVVNLKDVVELGEELGIEYAFVEQDSNWINGDSIESIQKSFQWLHENIK